MIGIAQHEELFIRGLPTELPAAAQRLYVDAYKQSMAKPVEGAGASDELTRESMAARDAWAAVRRLYREDPATLKWRLIADQATAGGTQAAKPSFLGRVKGLFKL